MPRLHIVTRSVGIVVANLHRFAFVYAGFAIFINDGYGSAANGLAKRKGECGGFCSFFLNWLWRAAGVKMTQVLKFKGAQG